MNKEEIIKKTAKYIKEKLEGEGSGHDWWHVYRVWQMAKHLAKKEKADLFTVELAALLHDIADWKFHDEKAGGIATKKWLEFLELPQNIVDEVSFIVDNISWKGGTNKTKMKTIEGKVVQDADRLDAIGAIGIARAFAFGGNTNAKMHDPDIKPMTFKNFEEFKKSMRVNTVINHFYEKLLLLRDKMNTKTAKEIAIKRHEFMIEFLDIFYKEWNRRG